MKRKSRRLFAFTFTLIVFCLLFAGLTQRATIAEKASRNLKSNNESPGNIGDTPPVSGTWTRVTSATTPASMTNCLVLTDGRVMCQRVSTAFWFALTPDSSGSYVNGTWAALASMQSGYNPLYFASAVLPDGRVIVEGGEYNCDVNGANCMAVWQTQGAIYNPTTNSWTTVSPPTGWSSIGDASGIVLADGTFFLSDCCTKKTAKFNSSLLTWTAFGTGYQASSNDEAGWTLLPDNSLLTVDASPTGSLLSERFNPTTGVWSSAGNTPVSLVDNETSSRSFEIGPGTLRPDGTVFYVGANPNIGTPCCVGSAHTAIFNTATGIWQAGPNIPNSDAGNDAPAAVLPNGNVLMQVAPPASATNVFGTPSRFYEFDGSTITQVNSPTVTNYPSFVGGMLVLPTGQILFTRHSTDVEVYTPVGSANPAWAPTITSVPSTLQQGATYTVTGTQFNGLTQGGYYGDDQQAATNYPLVRITNNASGHVFYARTHGPSSMGVATGSALVSTSFDVPPGMELGAGMLTVVANGIAASPVSVNVTLADPLRLDTVAPPAGRTSGGQQIILRGAFAGLSTVTMGGAAASFIYTNGPGDTTSITVTTPAHAVGAVQIDLMPTSGSVVSKANAFAYLPTVFTDDTILVGQTTAKAQHILELRQAVDAMRAVAGLSGAPWTDPALAAGDTIKATHILDLRTFLDDAATRLGFSTSAYTDPGLAAGFMIKRIHIEELRQRIRTIAG